MPSPAPCPRALPAALSLGLLLTLLLTLLTPPPAHAARARHQADETTPLAVTIQSMTPSVLPGDGPLVVQGVVTNTDDEAWESVGVYPFVASTPITSVAALEESVEVADADPEDPVGDRILDEGSYTTIDRIEPGASVAFSLTVPRTALRARGVTTDGVYWFGVHALGGGPEGYDRTADGRARTLLPLVTKRTARAAAGDPVRAAVVVPVRARALREDDGRLTNVRGWIELLNPDGRLGRLAALGSTPQGRRLTWLVDPAVLDALRQLASGNPPRDLGPTDKTAPEEPAQPDAGAADDVSGSPSPSASASPDAEPDPATVTAAALAERWLSQMLPALADSDVLGLPYGDLDLPGAAGHDPKLYETARTRSDEVFASLDIDATAINAPPTGWIDDASLEMLEPDLPVLVSDQVAQIALEQGDETGQTTDGSVVATASDRRLLLSSAAAAAGGPTPGDPLAGVPLRQRLLAEAALRLLDDERPPLLVALPSRWRGDPALVDGLEQSWLELPGLAETVAGETGPSLSDLTLPTPERRAAVGKGDFLAAESLIRAGGSLQRVLTHNDEVATATLDEALTTVSYFARGIAGSPAAASRQWIEDKLGSIHVEAPAAVTLSSSNGRFAATVVNDLPEPVTVRIAPVTDSGITVGVPRSVEVAAEARATVLLSAEAHRAGLHNVGLQLTDSEGFRLGGSTTVPIRSAQVSGIIWLFLGLGAALLFGAIGLRLVRRVRAAHRHRDDEPGDDAQRGPVGTELDEETAKATPSDDGQSLTGAP